MSRTYAAILHGDRVEWQGEAPEASRPVAVSIVLEEAPSEATPLNGPAVADALERLASRGGVKIISDPVAWQREQRRDRPLPGRESP